ncbi:hypothetical protein [Bdellovibrio sp. HCB-162]|uniref:hypothetical protein n=1 Tax=Bdellovibrio sp. HCB-162 TaxID=3394234 RepID=UPI0039BC8245
MRTYFRRQFQEILNSKALQIYGGLLALTHVLTAYFWTDRSLDLVIKASEISSPLCWPMVPFCDTLRFTNSLGAAYFLEVYAMMGIATAALFFLGKIRLGYVGLIFLLLLKVFFTSLSYGLMGNYHYMSFFTHLAFLFFPRKKVIIPFFIGIFYWGAGILKFDPEWLSGVALISPSFLPSQLQHFSLAYAVLLECVFVLGLFSHNKWIRSGVFVQFLLFHIFSWHIVGYFYPLTMFLLLGLFALIPLFKENWEAYLDSSTLKNKSTVILCSVLILLQVIPSIAFQDPATTGAPRILSLNMLDARVECETLLVRHQNGSEEVYDPFVKAPSTRTQCDPLVFLSQIKSVCKDPTEKFDFWLQSRRTTTDKLDTRLFVKDICNKNPASILWTEFL